MTINFFSLKLPKKISALDITLFFRQLATLINSNISIIDSFLILEKSQEKPPCQHLMKMLRLEIEKGQEFVSGLRKFPHYFDELTCHLIQMGEQTGTLDHTLKRIAHYREKSLLLKNKIKQALFYPVLIFIVAFVISVMMLTFVVPRFAELFQSMHGQLPIFTQFILNLSDWIRDYYWLGSFPIIASLASYYYFKKSKPFRYQLDSLILHLPFIHCIIKKIILTRFIRSLSTTLAAGIPITEALKIVAYTSGNQIYTQHILKLRTAISTGRSLHIAMTGSSLFPALCIQMIRIGEECGSLDHLLDKTAELYESDMEHFVSQLSHLLEPLIMLILGVLIGGLVIALYLPIFKLGTVI